MSHWARFPQKRLEVLHQATRELSGGASGGFRLSEIAKLLVRKAHHSTCHLEGQGPIPFVEQIQRSLIAIRIAAGGGHPLQGFQRQLTQRGCGDAKRLQGEEQSLDRGVRSGS